MSKPSITFIVLLLSISIAARAETDQGTESFDDLITKLNYGDKCSWKTEKSRQAFLETMFGDLEDNKLISKNYEEFKLNATKNGKGFCNALGLLICNKETKICDCGDPTRAALLGQQAGSKSYVVETTDDGQQHCRWAENEGCAPDDDKLIVSPVTLNSQCQKGTSCLAFGKRHACSHLDILVYVLNNKPSDVSQISKDVFNGRLCSCQSGGSTQSQDDNLDNETDSTNSRVRRFARAWRPNTDMSVYGGVISPFVDSF